MVTFRRNSPLVKDTCPNCETELYAARTGEKVCPSCENTIIDQEGNRVGPSDDPEAFRIDQFQNDDDG